MQFTESEQAKPVKMVNTVHYNVIRLQHTNSWPYSVSRGVNDSIRIVDYNLLMRSMLHDDFLQMRGCTRRQSNA